MTSLFSAPVRAIPRAVIAALIGLALVAGACSSGDDTTETGTADETQSTQPQDPPEASGSEAADDETDGEHDNDEMEGAHDHGEAAEVTWTPVPTLGLEVFADPKSGWNVHATPGDFTLAPEHASTEPIDGEGHMHIYVDGEKISRVYGEWFYLPALGDGSHHIRVELSANNHAALAVDGVVIDASVTVEEGDPATGDDGAAAPPPADALAIDVVGGEVTGGGRVPAALGSEVVLVVTSDTADRVHVHGYDILVDLPANEATEVAFTAELPGVWEIELEDSGVLLAELEVS